MSAASILIPDMSIDWCFSKQFRQFVVPPRGPFVTGTFVPVPQLAVSHPGGGYSSHGNRSLVSVPKINRPGSAADNAAVLSIANFAHVSWEGSDRIGGLFAQVSIA